MKSDVEIRRDVEAELRWEPRVNDVTATPSKIESPSAFRRTRSASCWSRLEL